MSARVLGSCNPPGLWCEAAAWDFGDGEGFTKFGFCPAWRPVANSRRLNQVAHVYDVPGSYTVTAVYGGIAASPLVVIVE